MLCRPGMILSAGLVVLLASGWAHADVPVTQPAAEDVDMIPTVNLVPTLYRHRLVQQLSIAEDNQQTWLHAIVNAPPEHRQAVAYLLVNMPENDLKTLKGDFLLNNVELAYQAREQTAWGKAVPQEIFLREVLPYFNVNERRDDWRKDYYDRFMPLVKNASSAGDAAMILNKQVFPIVKVKYHATKREKPDQSPYESARIGFASCTGLTIILSDACRAVGVPARLVGTPLWTDKSGNHTWTEVWDRQWYFVGAAEPGKLNETWFVDNAAKADPTRAENRIYAASFEQTSLPFPMIWATDRTDVHAEDVTAFYVGRQTLTVTATANTHVEVRHNQILVAAAPTAGATFSLGAGENYTVSLLDAAGKLINSKEVSLPRAAGASVTFLPAGN